MSNTEQRGRTAFEAALRNKGYRYFDGAMMGRGDDAEWEYQSAGTQHAWNGWQAAMDATPSTEQVNLLLSNFARACAYGTIEQRIACGDAIKATLTRATTS